MDEPGDKKPEPAVGARTIQIDALTDVQLIDNLLAAKTEGEDGERSTAAPPPLPRKQASAPEAAPRSTGRTIALILVAAVAGGAIAYGAVHFLFPSAPAAPSAVTAPPSIAAQSAAAPSSAAPASAAPPSTAPRRVTLDEELVIHAGDGTEGEPEAPPATP